MPMTEEEVLKQWKKDRQIIQERMRPNAAYEQEEKLMTRYGELFNTGRYAEARSVASQEANLYKNRLDTLVAKHGSDSPDIISVLVRYAYACISAGQKEQATRHLKWAAALINRYRVTTINRWANTTVDAKSVSEKLAELLAEAGKNDDASQLQTHLVESATTREEKARALRSLYENAAQKKDFAAAVAIAKQYVASGGDRMVLAEALERVALWAEAAKQYSVLLRQLDSDDSSGESADLYYRLARCYTKLGQKALAGKYLRKSLASEQQFRAQALLFPESAEIDSFLTYDSLGRSSLSIPDNRYELEMALLSPEEIASLIIRQKYAPQDALLENIAERASAAEDPVGAAILADLKRVKNAEAHHVLQCAIARQKTDECYRCTELRRKRQDMERCLTYGLLGGRSEDDSILLPSSRRESDYALAKLKKARPRRAAVADLGKIREGLPAGTAIVEFFSYQDIRAPRGCLRYAAAVICGDTNVQVVELPTVSEVDGYISRFTSHSHEAARKLWELVWLPLDKHFDSVSRVIICPEGSLNLVPFAALCDKADRFVCEDKEIVYVVSSRDLLVANQFTSNRNLVAFGNPQASIVDAGSAMEEDAIAPDLPGAEQEVELIRKIATDLGWQVEAQIGVAANETELRRIHRPTVLHCAMHALFPDMHVLGDRTLRGMKPVGTGNTDDEGAKEWIPADESGVLVLAGGEDSAREWLAGERRESTESDGVFTGKEAVELNLRGTWLTVLSACDTATIDVQGLRRGFMLAGSANLLMTLWPIPDQDTAQIMETFYKRALLTGNAPLSLAQVQKEWLIKLRDERGVAAAITAAGPFVLFTTGDPQSTLSDKKHISYESLEHDSEPPAEPKDKTSQTKAKSPKIMSFNAALANAEAGDGYAQAVVSIYYGLGLGCNVDLEKSKKYVMLSAKQGNALGLFRLAEMREAGEAMQQNPQQAAQLMQKAKAGLKKLPNDPYAMTALAIIYERTTSSSQKIRELLTKASEMGYEPAQTKLSQLNSNN